MNGKITGIKGKFTDKEFPLDSKRGVALAAPGGKRVEITYSGKNNAFILISKEYAVPVNGNPIKQTALSSGDIFVIGASEFRFDLTESEVLPEEPVPVKEEKEPEPESPKEEEKEQKDSTSEMKPVESERIAKMAEKSKPKESSTEELVPVEETPEDDHTDVLIPVPEEVKKKSGPQRPQRRKRKKTAAPDTPKKDGTEVLVPIPKGGKPLKEEKPEKNDIPKSSETAVADLEFCDICGNPLIEFAFKTGEAVKIDGKFFCKDCKPNDGTAALEPVEKPKRKKTRQRKPVKQAPPEKPQPQRRATGRRAPGKRGAAAGGGRAKRMMRQRARKRSQAEEETPKKKAKPAKGKKKVDKGAGTEPLEPSEVKKNQTDPLLPVPGAEKEDDIVEVVPVSDEELELTEDTYDEKGTDELLSLEEKEPEPEPEPEPLKQEKPKPVKKAKKNPEPAKEESPVESGTDEIEPVKVKPEKKPAKSSASARRRKARSTSRSEESADKPAASSRRKKPVEPKGPGMGEKIGKIFKATGKGIFLVFKYTFVGIASVFIFTGKRLKIWRLNSRMKHHLLDIGGALRDKRNQTAFISEDLAETARQLREMPEDSDERKKLILELGEKFLHEYSEHPDPAGIDRLIKSADEVEKQLYTVRGKTKGEQENTDGLEENPQKKGKAPEEKPEESEAEEPGGSDQPSGQKPEAMSNAEGSSVISDQPEEDEELKTDDEAGAEVEPVGENPEAEVEPEQEEKEVIEMNTSEDEPQDSSEAEEVDDDDDDELELIDFPPPKE